MLDNKKLLILSFHLGPFVYLLWHVFRKFKMLNTIFLEFQIFRLQCLTMLLTFWNFWKQFCIDRLCKFHSFRLLFIKTLNRLLKFKYFNHLSNFNWLTNILYLWTNSLFPVSKTESRSINSTFCLRNALISFPFS